MLVHCNVCTCAYPPDAARCPHCGANDTHDQGTVNPDRGEAGGGELCPHCDYEDDEEDDDMAKISRLGGPSNAAETVAAGGDSVVTPPAGEPEPEPEVAASPEPDLVTGGIVDPGRVVLVGDGGTELVELAEDAEVTPAPTRPAEHALKSEWVAYARALGFDSPDLEQLTKAELINAVNEVGG